MASAIDLPVFEAGCRMPSMEAIRRQDMAQLSAAAVGSGQLLAAMLRYGARHGLPNLSADECWLRLQADRPKPVPPPPPKIDRRASAYRRREADQWTDTDDQRAIALRKRGLTYGTIARITNRTKDAVASRLRYIGFRGGEL